MKLVTECKNWKCSFWHKCARANNPEAPAVEVTALPTIFPPEMKLGEQCPLFCRIDAGLAIDKTTLQ